MRIAHLLDAVLDHRADIDPEFYVADFHLRHNYRIGLTAVGKRVEFPPHTTAYIEVIIAVCHISAKV